jgi:putative addiction module component (TIGR02574 family)
MGIFLTVIFIGQNCRAVREFTAYCCESELVMQIEALEHQVLNLPPKDRSRMLELLITSLDADDELDADWAQELVRRDQAADSDPSLLIPAEDVFTRLKAQLA